MARLSVEDQFKKLQKQKIVIAQLEQVILDKETRKNLHRIVAVIDKAVAAAHTIATSSVPVKKRGRPAGTKSMRSSKLAGIKIAPKYRNPDDRKQTWTGRGRMPLWAAELAEIGKLEAALIKKR